MPRATTSRTLRTQSPLCQVIDVITRQVTVAAVFWRMTKWLEKLTGETQTRLLHLLRRSRRSITELAEKLGLTDNAVRTHIAVLRREGIVEDVGTQRDTGGKPARLYGVTREGEEVFPKAYAPVLGMMIDEVIRRDGREHAVDLLRAVGALIAANDTRGKD